MRSQKTNQCNVSFIKPVWGGCGLIHNTGGFADALFNAPFKNISQGSVTVNKFYGIVYIFLSSFKANLKNFFVLINIYELVLIHFALEFTREGAELRGSVRYGHEKTRLCNVKSSVRWFYLDSLVWDLRRERIRWYQLYICAVMLVWVWRILGLDRLLFTPGPGILHSAFRKASELHRASSESRENRHPVCDWTPSRSGYAAVCPSHCPPGDRHFTSHASGLDLMIPFFLHFYTIPLRSRDLFIFFFTNHRIRKWFFSHFIDWFFIYLPGL